MQAEHGGRYLKTPRVKSASNPPNKKKVPVPPTVGGQGQEMTIPQVMQEYMDKQVREELMRDHASFMASIQKAAGVKTVPPPPSSSMRIDSYKQAWMDAAVLPDAHKDKLREIKQRRAEEQKAKKGPSLLDRLRKEVRRYKK